MSEVTAQLKEQGEAARALILNIRDVIGEDEEMLETAIEGETDLKEAIAAAVDRISMLNDYQESLETRIKSLQARRDRFEDQAARIKSSIHVAMGHAGLRKLELATATLSVRAVPAKVNLVDESLIPSKFFKTPEPKLDLKAVLTALKEAEAVPGAVLSNGGETISIRDK